MAATTEPSNPSEVVLQAAIRTLGALIVGFSGLAFLYLWGIVLLSLVAPAGEPSPVAETAVEVVATGLGTATAGGLYLWASDRGASFLDLSVPTPWDVAWGTVGLVALVAVLFGLGFLMDLLGIEQAVHGTVERAMEHPRILLVSIPGSLLFVGVGEELLYRNVIQKSLYEVYPRPVAIVVATVIFALAHFGAYLQGTPLGRVASLVSVFLLALVLGVVYERTENLVVVAAVHGTFNAVQFANLYCDLAACPP